VASFLHQPDADTNAQTKALLTLLHLVAGSRDRKDNPKALPDQLLYQNRSEELVEGAAFTITRRTSIYHYLFEAAEGCINSSPQS
jgi:hypothetical protein